MKQDFKYIITSTDMTQTFRDYKADVITFNAEPGLDNELLMYYYIENFLRQPDTAHSKFKLGRDMIHLDIVETYKGYFLKVTSEKYYVCSRSYKVENVRDARAEKLAKALFYLTAIIATLFIIYHHNWGFLITIFLVVYTIFLYNLRE